MRLILILAAASVSLWAQGALRLERHIPLGNVEGRIDHLALDSKGQRLFVAALGNNTVEVVDLRGGKVIHSIGGLAEPQGLFYLADRNRLFVANGGDGSVRIFDGTSFGLVESTKLGGDADNLRYDAAKKRLWVGYGEGALAELDVATGRRLAEVRVEAHPESFQLEQAGPRIFVNVPNAGHIAVIDRVRQAVIAKWPVSDARANFPMALDEARHRLIVGCRKPARLLVYDTESGKQAAAVPICGDTDDLFWDGPRKRLYIACGEGFIDVLGERYQRIERVATAPGARTALFVPELDRFFLAVRRHGSAPAEIREYKP